MPAGAGLTTIDDATHRENRIRAGFITGRLPARDSARVCRAELGAADLAGAVLRPGPRIAARAAASPGLAMKAIERSGRAQVTASPWPAALVRHRNPPTVQAERDCAGGRRAPGFERHAAATFFPVEQLTPVTRISRVVPGAAAGPGPDPGRAFGPAGGLRVSAPGCGLRRFGSAGRGRSRRFARAAPGRDQGGDEGQRQDPGMRLIGSRPTYRRGRRPRRASARSACR